MKRLLSMITPLILAAALGGCAVYGPPPGYAAYPAYPGPVYAAPAAVYAPPVSFNLGVYGGHGWHHHY